MNQTRAQLIADGWIEKVDGQWYRLPFKQNEPPHKPLGPGDRDAIQLAKEKAPKRIRQSSKPLLNKTEQRCFDYLSSSMIDAVVKEKPMTFRLCNGVRLTPDIGVFMIPGEMKPRMIDVKGQQQIQDDAVVKLKFAAKEWPMFAWLIMWEIDGVHGNWCVQEILP